MNKLLKSKPICLSLEKVLNCVFSNSDINIIATQHCVLELTQYSNPELILFTKKVVFFLLLFIRRPVH